MPQPRTAYGRRKDRGVMNSTEKRFFEEVLEPKIASGKVVQWWYERWTWAMTDSTPGGKPGIRYTPDFVCLLDTNELVVFEIKGGNPLRAGLNRAKLFADLFPLRLYLVSPRRKKDGGGWTIEEY